MSSMTRTWQRAAGTWQRKGMDLRTGERVILDGHLGQATPLYRLQGCKSIGRKRGHARFERYGNIAARRTKEERQALLEAVKAMFRRKAAKRGA